MWRNKEERGMNYWLEYSAQGSLGLLEPQGIKKLTLVSNSSIKCLDIGPVKWLSM